MPEKPTYEELEQRIRELEKGESDCNREKAALREQLRNLMTLMDDSLDGLAIIDQTHRVRQANKRFAQMLGYTIEECLGLHTWDWEVQMNEEEIRASFADLSKTQTTFETLHRRKDGTIYDAEVTACGAELGEEDMILTITRDISTRKQAELALRESETRLKQILESTEDIIVTQDLDGRYTYYNGPSTYGLTYDDILGKTPYDFFDHETASRMMENVRKVRETGKRLNVENHVEWMGKVLWYHDEINPVFDRSGKVIATSMLSRNITERKNIENALAASEKRFRQMADLLPGAVVEMDAEMNIKYANQHGLVSFGYSQQDVDAGISGVSLVHPDDREKAFKRFSTYFEGQYLPPTEYRIVKKNGETVWVLFNATPIENDNIIKGFHCILIDISRRKDAEREREKLIGELQGALAEVKTLSGLLPICMYCKKIRTDEGYWDRIESYIQKHSNAEFSHGICQECAKKFYPDMDFYDD